MPSEGQLGSNIRVFDFYGCLFTILLLHRIWHHGNCSSWDRPLAWVGALAAEGFRHVALVAEWSHDYESPSTRLRWHPGYSTTLRWQTEKYALRLQKSVFTNCASFSERFHYYRSAERQQFSILLSSKHGCHIPRRRQSYLSFQW